MTPTIDKTKSGNKYMFNNINLPIILCNFAFPILKAGYTHYNNS